MDKYTKKEYIVAYLLESMADNKSFKYWPLHITIIPWFEIDEPIKAVEAINNVCNNQKSFKLTVGEEALFGPGKNRKANIFVDPMPLTNFHNALTTALEIVGAYFPHSYYMGKDYHPHVTKRGFANVQPGHQFTVNMVHLIEAPMTDRKDRSKKVLGIGYLK